MYRGIWDYILKTLQLSDNERTMRLSVDQHSSKEMVEVQTNPMGMHRTHRDGTGLFLVEILRLVFSKLHCEIEKACG